MRRLCTICARGGSKGVPNKNNRLLMGKPLIVHSIEQARDSHLFERIAVSSDSPAILAAARAAGIDDIVERPVEMASDTAAKDRAIHHAFTTIEARHSTQYETLVDLDATAPLRLTSDIAGAVDLLERSGVRSVITGSPSHRSPYFNLLEERADGSVGPSKTPPSAVVRRQDAPRTFDMNASIYVWRTDTFRDDPCVFYPDTRLFEMPQERSHDIDSELDFELVAFLLSKMAPQRDRFGLSGKVAMVTGGAGILGMHFTRALAEQGAAVAVVDLPGDALTRHAQSIARDTGARTLAVPCDIREPEEVSAAVERIEAELGPIDILHNNAATKGDDLAAFFKPTDEYDLTTWRSVTAVNLDALFVVAQQVGRRMASRRRGSIIQTSSIYGIAGPDQRIYEGSSYLGREINTPAVYSATKAGVIGLTRYFATLWGAANVRVNTLTPGGVSSGQNKIFEDRYSARVPLGRMAQANDMVGALIYLASDASSYVTGQNIIVDGGLTAW